MLNLRAEEENYLQELIEETSPETLKAATEEMERNKPYDSTGEASLRIYRLAWEEAGFANLGVAPGEKFIALLLLVRLRVIQAYEKQAQELTWEKISHTLKYGSRWQQQALCNQLHKSALAGMLIPAHSTTETTPLEKCFNDWDTLTLSQQAERAITFADYMVEHDC